MKKRIGRRLAAFVLCLAMCLQSVSMDAFAEEISEQLPVLSEESPKQEDVSANEIGEETTDETEAEVEETSGNEVEADSVYYTRAINHALAKAEGLGDLQKIVFFHDYLATNCLRSKDTSYNTAEHALVEQTANNEGYALAYQALLTAAGLECYVAKSSSLGKAWNIVKYNGYYYNVDVYTDDYYPVGNVNHNFMMCSDTSTSFSSYQGKDKVVTKDGTTYSISCSNTVYDDFYWRKAVSPIVMDSQYRDECYYIEYTDNYNNALKRGNFINSASFFTLKESTASSSAIDIWHGNGMTYGEKGIYSGLFEKNGWIYYNTTNSICCVQYNAKGDGAIYTYNLDSGTSLYGIDLYYDVKNDKERVRYITATGSYWGVDPYGTITYLDNFDFSKRPSGGGGGPVDPDPDPDPTSLSAPVISITEDSTGSHVVLDNGTIVFDFGTTLVVKFTQAENATVYYTKNGSEPTTSSTAGNIINVYNTCTVKAKAIQGNISSETTTMNFERASNTFTIASTLSLSKGAQGKITVSALPTSKTEADITWSSSDTQVATVDQSGNVTGVAGGTATITAATTNYKGEAVSATCKVTVSDNTKYTVTFIGLNGKVLKTQEVTAGSNATPPTNTSETGYTFDSWVGNYTSVHKNETVTAKYNPIHYTITYNLNGGTDPGNATSYTIETSTITLKNPTKTGYEFGGWYTSSACTGTAVTTIAKGSTGNKTFYAKWNPISFTITYNLNGGTDPGNATSYTSETATITLKNPTKTGYEFGGWFTNSACTGTAVTTIAKGSTGNKTFYAKWNPISYTITYNLNGGTDPGNATSYTIETSTISLKNPTKTGYEFGGWYTSSACTGTAVTTIAKGSTGNKTFYAKWSPISYTITYNLNGGTDPGNATSYTIETSTITLKNPTKTGYVFTGWYENASCSGASVTQIVKGSTGNKTFYAGWDENPVEYTVTFYAKDGVTKIGTPQKVYAGKSATAPTPPEIKGYTFDKWSVAFDNVHSDLSVVAQYKPTNYKITYQVNGGAYAGDNPNSYTIESETITLKNATGRTGYRFLGWYANEDFSGNQVTEIKKGTTGDITLYAKWEEIFYTVKFVGFKGVLIKEVQVKEGASAQAPAIPDIVGYNSAGWDGSYTNVREDLTITAKYTLIHYGINYVLNGGANNGGNPTSYNIESMISLKPAGDKNGYTFAGWYDNAGCTGNPVTEIAAGNTGNKTLYAKWKNQKTLWLKWKNLAEDQELSTPYTGSAIKPEFDVYMGNTLLVAGVDYSFAYKNNVNANLLSTDAEKKKAPVVIITGKGNYAGKVEKTFKITPKSLNDSNDIKYAVPALTYNGKVQKAVPTVVWGTKKLANKKDFDLVYPQESAGSYAEPGKYTLQIVGKGNYTGTIYASQIIVDEKKNTTTLNINKAKATAIPAFTYSGNAVSLENANQPVVKYGKEILVCGTDYTLDYNKSAKEIGTYPVIIRGKGKYYGEIYTSFQIKGIAASSFKVVDAATQKTSITTQTYTGKEIKPAILVKDAKGNTLTSGVDYTLSYSNNMNAGKGQITITGKGHYTGVKKVSFTIKPLEMDANRSSFTVSFVSGYATHSYVKGGVKPKLIVKYGSSVLVEGKDYSLSYKNNTAIGENPTKKPTIIVTGKKNFAKSFTVEFSIKKANLSQVTMTAADMVYNATAGKYMSNPVLTDVDGKKLVQGKDYKDIEYYDINGNKMDKTAKPAVGNVIRIKVYGMGNYEGTKEVTYRIFAKGYSIASAKITILNKKYYDGEPVTLSKDDLKVEMGKVILSADDYEIVSYSNNIAKGNAKVTIRGVGKYAGTKTFSLPIASKQLVWWSK